MRKSGKPISLQLVAFVLVGAVGAAVLLILSSVSLGWFISKRPVKGYAETFAATDSIFELAVADKNGVFDSLLAVYDGEAADGVVTEDGTPISLTATGSGKTEIKWLMSDESNFGNTSADGIQPGSHGKLTFYVVPKQNTDLELTFTPNMLLYDSKAEAISAENPDNSEHIIPQADTASKLVKGHILFFENYDEVSGIYSGRISDNFGFTKLNAEENTAYKVEFYWVWPLIIDELILPANDDLLVSRGFDRIIESGYSAISEAEASIYFTDSVSGLSDMLDNMSRGSDDPGFDRGSYELLNAKWNEADQVIGTKVGYIELSITAEIGLAAP